SSLFVLCFVLLRRPPSPTPFPYTTLFRSSHRSLWPTSTLPQPPRPEFLASRCTKAPTPHPPLQQSRKVPLRSPRRPSSRSPDVRSEEHTSELQSRENLVCRLLLEKKNRDK